MVGSKLAMFLQPLLPWLSVFSEPGGSREGELPVPRVDHARSIWTSPFTLPSTIIKNTHRNKRNWSESIILFICYLKLTQRNSLAGTIVNVVVYSSAHRHDD